MKPVDDGRELSASEYKVELDRQHSQMLVFAREISEIHQQEYRQAQKLQALLAELQETYLQTVQTIAYLVEAKDQYTRYHLDRCDEYATALTAVVEPDLLSEKLRYGFFLHDVGKVGVPEKILSKPAPLSPEEERVMRQHPIHGVQFVGNLKQVSGDALDVIRHHHERLDGSGYPDGLKGSAIPLAARIFSVVDAFDAMTTTRPYRGAMSVEEALQRLTSAKNIQFDPDITDTFCDLIQKSPHLIANSG